MPPHSRHAQAQVPTVTSYGQVIEYITNRVYLASYTHPPDENTPFPYLSNPSKSPSKRTARAQGGSQEARKQKSTLPPLYFSIDQMLLYNAFYHDFGPLHMGHLYRFAVYFHDILCEAEVEHRSVVFWSSPDPRSRANAACVLAVYMVLIQNWPPHLALAPIAQMDPPCMPFRDAGYSQADYSLTVQDVVYGVWKAKEEGLIGLKNFSLEEYEKFERADMGDFNWISPDFLAFASPQHEPRTVIEPSDPLYAKLPRSLTALQRDENIPVRFKNVLVHFAERGIGLVVRLNSELYSPTYFTALGIQHLDMIFDDGTCPKLDMVRNFINLAHSTINEKQKGIAVHCKAGLGRTGCLIGAYLIYRYGMTANEVIAYMRFMRPGMVVGPQQHWLHLNQNTFREWWFTDTLRAEILASMTPATPTRLQLSSSQRLASNGQTFTPPHGGERQASSLRRALGEITNNEGSPSIQAAYGSNDTRKGGVGVADENLPAPTPGQPRKTSRVYGVRRMMSEKRLFDIKPDTETVTAYRTTSSIDAGGDDAELALKSPSRQASQSPLSRSGKRPSVSCITTTTTVTKWDVNSDASDAENQAASAEEADAAMAEALASPCRPKTPSAKSGSGMGSLSVSKRSSPARRSTEGKTSVRKTSGRIGSVGSQSVRVHKGS